MRFTDIPKSFLNAVYVGDGPWGGPYAEPCFCGRPMDQEEGDSFYILKKPNGDIMSCHEECVEGLSSE